MQLFGMPIDDSPGPFAELLLGSRVHIWRTHTQLFCAVLRLTSCNRLQLMADWHQSDGQVPAKCKGQETDEQCPTQHQEDKPEARAFAWHHGLAHPW